MKRTRPKPSAHAKGQLVWGRRHTCKNKQVPTYGKVEKNQPLIPPTRQSGSLQPCASSPTASTSHIPESLWATSCFSCPPFSHAVAIFPSTFRWKVRNVARRIPMMTQRSLPRQFLVRGREDVLPRAWGLAYKLQVETPPSTGPVFGIQHQWCEGHLVGYCDAQRRQ